MREGDGLFTCGSIFGGGGGAYLREVFSKLNIKYDFSDDKDN